MSVQKLTTEVVLFISHCSFHTVFVLTYNIKIDIGQNFHESATTVDIIDIDFWIDFGIHCMVCLVTSIEVRVTNN
jgi:hypothetical protein